MKLIIAATLMVLLAGCNGKKPADVIKQAARVAGCAAEEQAVVVAVDKIATQLSCKNSAEIKSDILNAMGKADLCKKADAAPAVSATATMKTMSIKSSSVVSTIGTIACPIVSEAVTGLIAAQIPATWECSPDAKVDMLKSTILDACQSKLK